LAIIGNEKSLTIAEVLTAQAYWRNDALLCCAPMTSLPRPPRATCADCQRPARACICRWIAPTANLTDVLLLQHPLEVGNAKNSMRLLELSLARRTVIVGEQFAPDELERMLDGPKPGQARPVLLYPDTPGMPSKACAVDVSQPLRLVVLDATWRKSRKMLALNPALQALPRLALQAPPPSRYLVRKAHRAGQLSTLEAVCHALVQLEGDEGRYLPLLAAFDDFVAGQLTWRNSPAR
jgi:DTW domain-containing protein YfiP